MDKVVYYSRGGNTKKLADAVAEEIGVLAVSVEEYDLTDKADILFVGTSIYVGKIDKKMRAFLETLDSSNVKKVVVFGSGVAGDSALEEVKSILEPHRIVVSEACFYCKGSFLLANRGRPNEEDLEDIKKFVRRNI